ncbi:Hypothetical predicted protein [Lynx pardinus]|uniref:Uncharacterized protein n=1 Tax=Lynx pardinus TaxID=191816 RepID=A0A485NTR8_LYNPA|nr:Hypothetical predicted protein [Lynx pardinus]
MPDPSPLTPPTSRIGIIFFNFIEQDNVLCYGEIPVGMESEKWFKQRLAQWRRSEGLPSECRSVTD